ncbi:MAG: hypothetical protein JNK76_03335 [Planctomycetales bacterium]|nr:hypothetical protein [Planctomycetales bacterium]MBN8627231.1 hypothetical protein [Planctomycetota bacterium]
MFKTLTAMLVGIGLIASTVRGAEPTTVRGEVKSFHESPKGDVDGVTLADGAEIRFPPHVGKQVQAVVAVGDEVSAKVEKHVTPNGDEHLRAERITNVKSGKSVDCGIPPPDKKAKPAPKPEVAKKPRAERPKGEPGHELPHEQILAEIRELRALVGGGAPTKDEVVRERREGPPHERILAELRLLRTQLERKAPEKR